MFAEQSRYTKGNENDDDEKGGSGLLISHASKRASNKRALIAHTLIAQEMARWI